jgi:hypothetical protein
MKLKREYNIKIKIIEKERRGKEAGRENVNSLR